MEFGFYVTRKLRFYRISILPVILYGAEIWSPNRQLARTLDAFNVVYYEFSGRPVFLMKRSADLLISHHSHTSSVPPA